MQELYSGANDNNIIVWSPLRKEQPEEVQGLTEGVGQDDEDRWSDDA